MRLFKNNCSDPRIIRMLRSTLVIIFAFVIIIITSTLVIGISIEYAKFPSLLGNQPQNVKNVQSHIDPDNFTFIVIGDVKDGTSTFESLLDIAEKENPSFIVILGDLVSHISQTDHKLFAYEISEYAEKTPFFIIPGNHDTNPDSFSLEDFQQTYGPAQFYFTIGSYLFVFLNDLTEYNQNGEYLDYLEDVLQANSSTAKKTFVFTHIPPSGLSDLLECSTFAPYSARFIDIVKKYHIDYVFTGHHHGYIKTEKDETTYITTGGGGSKLEGSKGRFHHFVEINIEDEKISENVVAVEHKSGGSELLESNIAVCFWNPIIKNKLISAMIILAFCTAAFTALFFLKRKRISGK